MNRPSDRAIAEAFREECAKNYDAGARMLQRIERRAAELDASGGGGEAVAWQYEAEEGYGKWRTYVTEARPDAGAHVRNVRPLYASPAADAGVRVAAVPANCRERLRHEGKPYPRSSCDACGKFSPKSRECDILLDAAAIAQFRAASTQEGG